MTAIIVSDLDDSVLQKLRIRAEQHGSSMGGEVGRILAAAVAADDDDDALTTDLFTALTNTSANLGGTDLDLPPRR